MLFSFLSQSGFTHTVQYRTDLSSGLSWQIYSNILGDGTLKAIPMPLSVFGAADQGFVRVSTHQNDSFGSRTNGPACV